MSVSCECCVLSDRDVCDELITRPEGSYRAGFAFVCDLENLMNEEALIHWPGGGGTVSPKTYEQTCFHDVEREKFTFARRWQARGVSVRLALANNNRFNSSRHHFI
jgi:hypothetical protein